MARLAQSIPVRSLALTMFLAALDCGCSGSNDSAVAPAAGGTSAAQGGATAETGGSSTLVDNGGGSQGLGGSSAASGNTGVDGSANIGGKSAEATGGTMSANGGSATGSKSAFAGGSATGGKSASAGGMSTTGSTTNVGGAGQGGSSQGTGGQSATGGATSSTNTHMYISGSDLYTYCGEKVLLRGVNQMSIWTDATGSSYPVIASFGTNAIRIVYTESGSASGLDTLLTKAEDNKMIPIPEIHDATGDFSGVPVAVNWWTQSAVVDVIKKHEKWTLLNIANEAGDNSVSNSTFQSTYTSAITSLRNAGITVPIVIDGSGWGQNVEQLLAVAPALLAADPQKNVIFSWHEYTGGSQEDARITKNLEQSKTLGIVLINGEFASAGAGGCVENIPYQFLLSEAQRIGTGWLAWSWDTSNSDCNNGSGSVFNMTSNLTSTSGLVSGWPSDVMRDDPNSIKSTSVRHCEWK